MNNESIITLIVLVVLAALVLRFVARIFLKLILVIILGALAIYMFIQGGVL
ncbi:MAG TPA: hypothetical protein VK155_05310 [Bacteroidales bacterium]|jgi:uncharacterized membrane protein|nr:hypothetical protein [Bacteroidales bacterium]